MSTYLITYATNRFICLAQNFVSSGLKNGFNNARIFTPADIIQSTFFERNKEILLHPRGAGYWLWKPYIILKTLKQMSENEVLMYCDTGRSSYYQLTQYPGHLIDTVKQNKSGILLAPVQTHMGRTQYWTKRDCLILMGSDTDYYLNKSQILATWSLWRPTQQAFDFLNEWLFFCEDARCLTDQPNSCGYSNYPEFKDHRHDQSVLSLLAYKRNASFLNFSHTLTHRALLLKPQSMLAHQFYKRPENANYLLSKDNPSILIREYMRLKQSSKCWVD